MSLQEVVFSPAKNLEEYLERTPSTDIFVMYNVSASTAKTRLAANDNVILNPGFTNSKVGMAMQTLFDKLKEITEELSGFKEELSATNSAFILLIFRCSRQRTG